MGFILYTKIITKILLNPTFSIVLLTACSPTEQSHSSDINVIAKVNGDEITYSQFNIESQKIKVKIIDSVQLSQKLISGLIDRQLFAQEALKLGLDRNQEVQEAVNAAKTQIYAQAYIAKKVSKLPMPHEQEINQFVDQHPQYFAERKVVNTIDIIFENNNQQIDLHRLESQITTLEALRKFLNDKGIPFKTVNNRFSTDGLPFHILDKIKQLKAGDLLFAHDTNKVIVKAVSSIEPSFVSTTQAQQTATRLLLEQRQQDFIVQELNRLKALANIEVFESNLASVASGSTVTVGQQSK
jgi:peptidyl-prolyl cis-trans isomerase C